MTFRWEGPPWQRNEDCTHMAVTLTNVGDGQIAAPTESVRGVDAIEALADLLMRPGGTAKMSGLVGVVVRRGIDVMWMAQPPIRVAAAGEGQWEISVDHTDPADVTAFSAADAHDLLTRPQASYG